MGSRAQARPCGCGGSAGWPAAWPSANRTPSSTLARWRAGSWRALREAWWEARLAELDAAAAQQRLHTQRALEADAMRRVNAGQEAPLAHNQAAARARRPKLDWLRA